ncbi:FtsK/SpoIIIE domain-containing protein [Saccharopolyspora pogona]|uniref:hypothetical protein n=1 Tax=Saccharopolyspora pogona TaxID=333966 RepID=UPI001686F494|nr:hypothetical protein [Saccharopolyspora pogona]
MTDQQQPPAVVEDQADAEATTITADQDRSGATVDDDQADTEAAVSSLSRAKITAGQVLASASPYVMRARVEAGHVAQGWRSLNDTDQDTEDSSRTREIVTGSYVVGNALTFSDLFYGLGDPIPQLPGLLGWITTATIAADLAGLAWLRYLGTQAADDQADGPRISTNAAENTELVTIALRDAEIIGATKHATLDGGIVEHDDRWTAEVLLPKGKRTRTVADKREALASALDVAPQQIAISPRPVPRRFGLTVYREVPFTGRPDRHPLITAGQAANVGRDGLDIGTDIDGRRVIVDLAAGRHVLVVAKSGNGKSVGWLRSIAATLGCDPSTTFDIIDGKGAGALAAWENVARHYVSRGTMSTKEDFLDCVGAVFSDAVSEIYRRSAILEDVRAGRQDAGDMPADHVIIVDEFQVITGSSNGEGQGIDGPYYPIRQALVDVARLGREVGVRLVLASQHFDGRALDDDVADQFGVRIIGYVDAEMSKRASGEQRLDTSTMLIDVDQAGTAAVIAPGIRGHVLTRSPFVNDADATTLGRRAAELRRQGSSTSTAAGDAAITEADDEVAADADDAADAESADPRAQLIAALGRWIESRPDAGGTVRTSVLHGELDGPVAEWSSRRFGDELAALDVPKIDGRYPTRDIGAIRAAVRRARLRAV